VSQMTVYYTKKPGVNEKSISAVKLVYPVFSIIMVLRYSCGFLTFCASRDFMMSTVSRASCKSFCKRR